MRMNGLVFGLKYGKNWSRNTRSKMTHLNNSIRTLPAQLNKMNSLRDLKSVLESTNWMSKDK